MHDIGPLPLLPTTEQNDFSRNFKEMQKFAKRPYSLTRVLRACCKQPQKLDALEAEVDQELQALNRARSVTGKLVPMQALSSWRRDLSTGTLPTVQTTVEPGAIPFLRARTVCGRLGATLLDDLVGGNLKMPRTTVGGTAAWVPETGAGADADQSLDSFTLVPKRITASTTVSRQLVLQSSLDIEDYVKNDLSAAVGVAVDHAALAGTGTGSQPLGILNYPVNAAGSYAYDHRSANVTFGGPASWASVLAFEKNLELGLVANDGTYGWATDPTVRDKWQQTAKVATYPSFLWENTGDDDTFGRVNGRRALSSTQLPAGQVLFGRWSDLIVATWVGLELLIDPFSLATQAEIRIRVNLLADIGLRYALSFCSSSDSGAQ